MYDENWLTKQGKKLSKRLMDIVEELYEMRDDAKESRDEAIEETGGEGWPEPEYWEKALNYLEDTASALEDTASELKSFSDDPTKEGLWK